MTRFAVALALLAVAAGCGSGEAGPGAEPDPAQLYEANADVLEAGRGPMLCGPSQPAIHPPQCGDLPIANWDWGAVEGEESEGATTWAYVHLVGTVDGDTFRVTEVGPPDPAADAPERDIDFTPPCPEPHGGWADVEPSRAARGDFEAGAARAEALPEYVALWVEHVGNPTDEEMMQLDAEGKPYPQTIMNVVVAEDVAGAEETIREVWGGPLCVVEREGHTEQELAAIREEAELWIERDLGLIINWSEGGDLGQGAAKVGVMVDPGGLGQAALDERYGEGIVRLLPVLTPVEE